MEILFSQLLQALPYSATMRNIPILISFIFLLASCDNFISQSVQETENERIILQSYAAACCGGCGQLVLIDNLKGEQQTLQVECDFERGCCRSCLFTTEKHIDKYVGKYIIERLVFKPVYDTISIKRLFPTIARGAYFDSTQYLNPLILLTDQDSLLISKALSYSSNSNCNKSYLSHIRGFIFIKTERVKFKRTI